MIFAGKAQFCKTMRFISGSFSYAGTLLMTEERQKAIWAIYGKNLTLSSYKEKCFLGRLLI